MPLSLIAAFRANRTAVVVCGLLLTTLDLAAAAQGAQTGTPGRVVALGRARRLMESGAPRDAEPLLVGVLAEAEAAGDQAVAGLAEVALARLKSMLGDRPSAERWYAAAEVRAVAHDLARTQAFVLYLRGNDAYARGDHVEAAARWRAALPLFERAGALEDRAQVLRALAFVVPLREAAPLLEEALVLARRASAAPLEALVLHGLSDTAYLSGEWSKALALVTTALPTLDRLGTPIEQARARLSLARLHRSHGSADQSLAEYRRAETLLAPLDRALGLSTAWATLSGGLLQLGKFDGALVAAERAIAVAKASGNDIDATFAALVGAETLLSLARPADALALIDASPRVGNGRRSLVVRRAYALSLLGRHAEALAAAQVADGIEGSVLEAIPANLATLAEVRRRAGELTAALADSKEAVAVLERLRGNAVPVDELRVGFDDGYQWVHGRLVRLLSDTGGHGDALVAAERARARAFTDLLSSRELGGQRLTTEPPALDGIVAEARRLQTSVVAYWTDADGVLIWVVTPDGLAQHASVAVAPARLARLVARTWSPSEPLGRSGGRTSAYRQLYDLLVRPIEGAVRAASTDRLTIVPHGPLFRLSFAGLQAPDGRYLVERVAVHYVPSMAALLALAGNDRMPAATGPGLVVASPRLTPSSAGERLPPLPGAAAEGQAVARLLAVPTDRVLASARATESSVRARLATARVVHFATHAIVTDERPMDSFLALANEAPGDDGDGRLTVEEVYGLSLDASLVVLSGCRTASGRVTGDGVVGLSRAFFVAGTPSIVASLWDLPDVAGQRMLPAFYRAWAQHDNLARALRDAQLALLRDLRAGRVTQDTSAGPIVVPAHPAVWAGLVLMGAP